MRDFEHFQNLVEMFFRRASRAENAPFLSVRREGHWQALSWGKTARKVARMAAALRRLGLHSGDRVMLVSENRPEWCIADLAIMAAGCITVPAYTSNTERDHEHVLSDSGARAAIVSTQKLAQPLLPAVLRSPACEHVIAIDPLATEQAGDTHMYQWEALMAAETLAVDALPGLVARRADPACIIYTSGTGGAPRGVILSHGAILHNVEGAIDLLAADFGWDEEVFLSFLPLSHALEHTAGQFWPIGLGAQIHYAESLEKLAANIEEVRPSVLIVVPRLFELLRGRMLKTIEKQGRFAQFLLNQALAIGARSRDGRPRLLDRPMDLLIERTLRPKIRARFGGRLKALVSGGAPLNPEVGLFFQSLGLTILQGYGLTETAPIVSCNRPSAGIRLNTVGPPFRNTEVRIVEDGEILVRGELLMQGYWRDEAKTSETVRNGWLHTGDVGHLDEAGRLVITDRKKDLIVLDKGDNVAPQRVEGMLTLQPEIAQAMVIGDRRPHLVALLVPDEEWTSAWCKANGKANAPALRDDPDYLRAISAAVDRVNSGLSVIEKVRRFVLADEPFTVENKQLTPSIKIRRHVLREVYGERLEGLYRA
jgi:long-chain acyl-CoA synthetase